MGRNSMTCEDAEKFVHVYLDGEFSEEDRRAFEAHLADCESCRKMVRFEERFKQALRTRLAHPPVPAAMTESISAALDRAEAEEAEAERSVFATWAVRLAPVAVAAAVAAAVVVIMEPKPGNRGAGAQAVEPDAVRPAMQPMVASARAPRRLAEASRSGLQPVASPVQPADYVTNAGYSGPTAGSRPMVRVRVVDPNRIPPDGFVGRWVAGRKVYFGMQAGLNVAMFEYGGIGYALTADLPEEELAEIVRTFLDR